MWSAVAGVAARAGRWLALSPWGRYVVAVLVAAVMSSVAYRAGQWQGRAWERVECQARASRAMVEVTNENRKREVSHAQQIQDLQTSYARQQQQAAGVDARATADLGSGARRMRFKVTRSSGAAACPPTTAPGGAYGTASAELAPEVAAALYSIARDGDEAIRQLTALQAWARDAVKLCGAVTP